MANTKKKTTQHVAEEVKNEELVKEETTTVEVNSDNTEKEEVVEETTEETRMAAFAKVNCDKLRLRSNSVVADNIIAILQKDTKVKLLEYVNAEWAKVEYVNSTVGFVMREFITEV